MKYLVVTDSTRYGRSAEEVNASSLREAAAKADPDGLADGDRVRVFSPAEGVEFHVSVDRQIRFIE